MRRSDALHVVRLMASAYNTSVSEDLLDAWWNASLEHKDTIIALRVARDLVGHSQFMPRPAAFNEAYRMATSPVRSTESAGELEAGAWEPNHELAKAELRAMREQLGVKRDDDGHD